MLVLVCCVGVIICPQQRTYEVIPMTTRLGIIEWMNDTVSHTHTHSLTHSLVCI